MSINIREEPLHPKDQQILDKILELCSIKIDKKGQRQIYYKNLHLKFEPGGHVKYGGYSKTFVDCHTISIYPKKGLKNGWNLSFHWTVNDKGGVYINTRHQITLEEAQTKFISRMEEIVERLCSYSEREIAKQKKEILKIQDKITKLEKSSLNEKKILEEFRKAEPKTS